LGREDIEKEFNLIQNAVYTEPADQSAWLYHHWLLGTLNESDTDILNAELKSINDLIDLEPESKWPILTKFMILQKLNRDVSVQLEVLRRLESIDPRRLNYYKDQRKSNI
jgi:geranylgeranyl transferase type-2 subunit alpha